MIGMGFWDVIGLLLVGLIVGAIARLLVRSPARLGCLGTAILGIIGSYAGGTLGSLLFHDKFDIRKAGTFIGALAGTIVLLAIWRTIDRGRGRLTRR
jgi:uncharacterized membrane protein YeaQ/YmgE (transglycosylase-associated protein family)